jgi:hypothetical protein
MLDFLLSPSTTSCYGRQSAKATADENHLIFNMDLFRMDGKHTIYNNLHFYLQSKSLNLEIIKVDSLNEFERI